MFRAAGRVTPFISVALAFEVMACSAGGQPAAPSPAPTATTAAASPSVALVTAPSPTAVPSPPAFPTLAPPPAATATPVTSSAGSATPVIRGANSKLSPRLQQLAELATAGTLPADPAAQNRLIGLAESGGGSLGRDASGRPRMEVRMSDTSPAAVAHLTALGASIDSVAAQYGTVTLTIDARRLNDLAALTTVQYAMEVFTPSTGR